METALGLARRGLGTVWPNPAVGCVLVRPDLDPGQGGRVVGRGWTQPGGRPHAEAEALRRAGPLAAGAVAYVTLEPCDHQGQTPPCSTALIAAGIRRVVAAIEDPDPRVSGAGLARLREAGIDVTLGVGAQAAAEVNAGFLSRVRDGRPWFTWKTATTLDSRIATASGESRWITGETARAHAHRLRAEHDAVMIGSGTALVDRPSLTCRLAGREASSPVRIVCDGRLRIDGDSPLVTTAREVPTWIVTGDDVDEAYREKLANAGVEMIAVPRQADGLDPSEIARELGSRGLTRVLIEGGGRLAGAMMRAGLVDACEWFRAPTVFGGDGVPALDAIGVTRPDAAPAFVLAARRRCGDDFLETYLTARHGPAG